MQTCPQSSDSLPPTAKTGFADTRGRLRKGLQIPKDGLTNWRTDRCTMDGRRVQCWSEYVLRCKKRTLKNPGEIFLKICLIFFEETNPVVQWKMDWICEYISGTGRQFWTKCLCSNICLDTSNCVFSKTIYGRRKNPVSYWRVGLSFRYHMWNLGETLYIMAMFNYFAI